MIRDLERTGKQFEVLIDGKKKTTAMIHRETKRYAHSDHGSAYAGTVCCLDLFFLRLTCL